MFGTLVLKTHRISLIFCNSHLQVIPKNSTLRMCQMLGIGIVIEMIINGIWLGVDPLTGGYTYESNGSDGYITTTCSSNNLTMPIISLCYKALIVLACVWYGFKTRHVVDMFNESRQLMTAAYNMAMCVLVTLILVIVLPSRLSRNVAFSYGSLFIITSTWMIVLLPKIYHVITGVIPSSRTSSHAQTNGTTTPHEHAMTKHSHLTSKRNSTGRIHGGTTGTNLSSTITSKRGSTSIPIENIPTSVGMTDIRLDTGILSPVDNNNIHPTSPTPTTPLESTNEIPFYEPSHPRSSMSHITPQARGSRAAAKNSI
jgi:hypothetical protein